MKQFSTFLRHLHRIKIEVTNKCNAKCIFCAYPHMKRPKMVMSEAIYESALHEISKIGCDVLMMSPVVGDPLLDKDFPYRLQRAKSSPGIGELRFFTNLIGLADFNDEELYLILNNADTIIVSLAPSRNLYLELFGVDRFDKVIDSLVRVSSTFCSLERKPSITFQGRARGDFEVDQRLNEAMRLFGDHLGKNWLTEYKDWGRNILPDNVPIQKYDRSNRRTVPCERALVPVIFCDGKVGICACADYDQKMVIGDLMQEKLETILVSDKRGKLLKCFVEGRVPEFCAKCTFYDPHPKPLEDWINAFADINQLLPKTSL